MANLPFISAGTLTLTNGSATVTGTGTTFTQFLANATIIFVTDTANNNVYAVGVESITDDVTLTISTAWALPTVSNANYFAQVLSNTVAGMQETAAKVLAYLAANADGKTVINGAGAPSNGIGLNGEFYIDTVAWNIHGPKAADVWPAGVAMLGTNGAPGTNGTDGNTILTGTIAPSNGNGANGDFYINTTTWEVHGPKAANVWPAGITLATGPVGADGRTILNGTGAPDDVNDGVNDDFYIDTASERSTIYGPKVGGAWPAGIDLVGNSVLNGTSAPSGALGIDGDFYIDTVADTIYGPKTAGNWGSSTSLASGPVGPTGPGVPNGGATDQVLAKLSASDQDTAWVDASAKVQRAIKTDTQTLAVATTWTAVTGLSLTVTVPAGKSVRFGGKLSVGANQGGLMIGVRILRDATPVLEGGAAGSRIQALSGMTSYSNQWLEDASLEAIDVNPGAGTYTYTVEFETHAGIVYINRTSADTDNTTYKRAASMLTAEIVIVV